MNVLSFFHWRPSPPPPAAAAMDEPSASTCLLDKSAATAAGDHVVIDVDDGGGSDSTGSSEGPSCAVCMEPLEWVAVGACRHAVVCPGCAARMRSTKNPRPDLRCCICRAPCPFVVVTKLGTAAAVAAVSFADVPATGDAHQEYWRARGYWQYCAAMSAYFDDTQQYKAAKAIAQHRQVRGGGGGGGRGTLRSCGDVVGFLTHMAKYTVCGVAYGFVLSLTAGAAQSGMVACVVACASIWMITSIFCYFG